MRRFFHGILWTLVVPACAVPGASDAKSYHLSNYDVEIDVLDGGDLHVTETLQYSFDSGTFTYAHREIPVRRFDRIDFLSLTSPDGPLTIDEQELREGWTPRLKLRWSFPETDALRTFRIEYVAGGVLKVRDDRHVLDWQAVGKDWKVPVDDVDVTVRLPGTVSSGIETRPAAETSVRDGATEVSFRSARVDRKDGLRVVVELPRIAGIPDAVERRYGRSVIAALAPGLLAIGALLTGLWWRVGRVEPLGAPSRPASYPDPELSVAEAACLAHLGKHARRSVMAVVFDLARRGVLRIEARAKSGFFGNRSFDVDARRTERSGDLAPWDQRTAEELAAEPQLKKLGESEGKIKRIVKDVKGGLRARGLISAEREAYRAKWLTGTVLLAVLATGFTLVVLVSVTRELLAPALLALAAGWGAAAMSASIETRTPRAMALAAAFRSWGRSKREEIENLLQADPAKAVSRLIEDLPELALDEKIDASWFKKIRKELRDRSPAFELPPWMEVRDSTGSPADATLAAAASFDAFAEVAGHVVIYAAGGASGGGGGGGGAGGGGGGAG